MSQPAEPKCAAQVTEPRASSAPSPLSLYLPHTPGSIAPAVQDRGRGPKETDPDPRRSGAAPRSLLTWPEDSSGDQEAEDQTAGRSPLRCHIPPPPGPPTESAPQEGGVVPGPALPARSQFGMQGLAASPRHSTAPWAVALHLLVSAARNFPPRSAPTPPPSLFNTRPWPPWLLLPVLPTLSSRETLEQFRKVYVVLFGWSIISLLLE